MNVWAIPFAVLMLVACMGLAIPGGAQAVDPKIVPGDVAWMLTATGLVLLMTPGLSFFYGGMVRLKNVISTMLQSFIALGVISILWVVVGFSLAFGDSLGFVGNPFTYFMFQGVGTGTHPDLAPTIPLILFALFQLKFAIITPALITGSFAERVRFNAYLLFICLFSLFIYCPLAHWTWHPNGFLRKWGVLDFAGGTVVHISAGIAALVGAMYLGRRQVHLGGETHTPANIPFVMLGTGMLWFGWFGFNAGSALAANGSACVAFLTTNTASAAAMLAWVFFDGLRGRKPSALGACIGAVVGLVAVTPAAGFVTVGQSIFIGAAGAVLSNMAVHWKSRSTLDDTLDVFPCHGVGGLVGMVFTGVFGPERPILAHLAAIVIVVGYTALVSWILYMITNAIIPLRVDTAQEELGLDLSQHSESMTEAPPAADELEPDPVA